MSQLNRRKFLAGTGALVGRIIGSNVTARGATLGGLGVLVRETHKAYAGNQEGEGTSRASEFEEIFSSIVTSPYVKKNRDGSYDVVTELDRKEVFRINYNPTGKDPKFTATIFEKAPGTNPTQSMDSYPNPVGGYYVQDFRSSDGVNVDTSVRYSQPMWTVKEHITNVKALPEVLRKGYQAELFRIFDNVNTYMRKLKTK